jgi:hypothetical protein|tara:strand:- start:809 stop:1567 length:759 start_codon:yes stop_codon:yes gene_type:complete
MAKGTYPQTAPTYGTYQWLQLRVGLFLRDDLDTNANYEQWDSYQLGIVDEIIQSGVRDFYFPTLAPGQKKPHAWSFLKQAGSFTLGTAVDVEELPADFGGMIGDMTWEDADAERSIKLVSEAEVRESSAMEDTDGAPKYASIRAKTATATAAQTYEVKLFPKPAAGQNLQVLLYRYTSLPPLLSTTNLYPNGVVGHAETIAAACLACAELMYKGEEGPMSQMYQSRLQASVMLDSTFLDPSNDDIRSMFDAP